MYISVYSVSGLTTHSKNRATWLLSQLNYGRSDGKSGRLPKIDPNFNVSFPHYRMFPYLSENERAAQRSWKDAINEFGIKYWTSNPVWVRFQEHESSFYVNIEGKVWLMVKKNTDLKRLTGRLKLRFLTEIGRFHWNQALLF
jgi:hypothetical protein